MTKRRKKMDENYEKLSQRAASTNDPQMKADIESLQADMKAQEASMDNFMKNKATMSPEQQERARTSLKTQDEQIKAKYEQLKTKYASSSSGKGEMNSYQQQKRKAAKEETTPKQ